MGTSVQHKPYAVWRRTPLGRQSSPVGWQSKSRPSRPSNTVLMLTSHTCRRSLGICERCTIAYEKTWSSIEGVSSLGVSGRLGSEVSLSLPPLRTFSEMLWVQHDVSGHSLLLLDREVPQSTSCIATVPNRHLSGTRAYFREILAHSWVQVCVLKWRRAMLCFAGA